jgi:hypothetical protein
MLSSFPVRLSKAAVQKAEREGSVALWSTKRVVPMILLAQVLSQYCTCPSSLGARTLVGSRGRMCPGCPKLSMLRAQSRSSIPLCWLLDETQSKNSRTSPCQSNQVQMSPGRELRAKTRMVWLQQSATPNQPAIKTDTDLNTRELLSLRW